MPSDYVTCMQYLLSQGIIYLKRNREKENDWWRWERRTNKTSLRWLVSLLSKGFMLVCNSTPICSKYDIIITIFVRVIPYSWYKFNNFNKIWQRRRTKVGEKKHRLYWYIFRPTKNFIKKNLTRVKIQGVY